MERSQPAVSPSTAADAPPRASAVQAPQDPLPKSRRGGTGLALKVASVLLLFAAWVIGSLALGEGAGDSGRLMPAPWDVVSDFNQLSVLEGPGAETTFGNAVQVLVENTLISARRLLLGLVIGGAAGIGVGLLFGWSARIRALAEGPLLLVRTIPLLALIPLFLTWFGGTDTGIVSFIAFAVFSMLLINTVEAIRNVPPVTKAYARTLGASELTVYRTVVIPAIVPELTGGIRVVIGLSWAILLAGEFLGAQSGIGRILILAEQYGDTSRMLLIVLLIMACTFLLDRGFARLSRSVTRWVPR
jgi:ABC-type nitrate/sulfonate/bicarbonate transport system permease component